VLGELAVLDPEKSQDVNGAGRPVGAMPKYVPRACRCRRNSRRPCRR